MDNYFIYPKQFKDLKLKIDEKMCFIIMPFRKERENVYNTIKTAVKKCKLEYNRADILDKSIPFVNNIMFSILSAYYLIVDISGLNANVLYELGIAHTLRDADRVLILKDDDTDCPSDLKHINYFSYNQDNLPGLYDTVVKYLKANHYVNDLKELMLLLSVTETASASDIAISVLRSELSAHCISLVYILNNLIEQVEESEVNETLIKLYGLFLKFFKSDSNTGNIFLKLICVSLQKLTKNFNVSRFAANVFTDINIDFDDVEMLMSKTDMAVLLIDFENENKEVYDWIKLFLYKSSPASVDVARYKLHVGIINSKSQNVKTFLLNILKQEKSCTLIEHALNLCRAKNIVESVHFALEILGNTDSPYVFRSAIDLITDVGSAKQLDSMFMIFIDRQKLINDNNFIDKHISRAKIKRNRI